MEQDFGVRCRCGAPEAFRYDVNRTERRLAEQIARLQRQIDEQGGQLKVLVEFVQTSLRNDIETRAERAAISLIDRLIALRDDEPQEGER